MATFVQSIIETEDRDFLPVIEVDIVDLVNDNDVAVRFTSDNYRLNTSVFMTRQQAEQLLLKLSEALD